MVCIFDISSAEAPDFKRSVQIDPEQTFEDFHQVIQRTCNFDHSQLASFFLTNEAGKNKIEITSLDSGKSTPSLISMRTTKLNKFLTEIGQKLTYVFDYFNDRFLFIELKEILMKTDLKEPFVAYENGKAPSQFLINDYSNDVDVLTTDESYKSFGDLEDYYEIFGEMDA
jgi:hypothetical protein